MHRSNRPMARAGLMVLLALCAACPEPQPDDCTRIAAKVVECETNEEFQMWAPVFVAMCRANHQRSTACAEATSAAAACMNDQPCAAFHEEPSACLEQMEAFAQACRHEPEAP